MKIAFRCDASCEIGTGHLRRSRALALALGSLGASTRFVVRDHGLDAAGLLAGCDVTLLPRAAQGVERVEGDPPHAAWAGASWRDDAAQTVSALHDWGPDILVVDHYAFDARWEARIRDELGCPIGVIDDLADRPHDCALLVDHNLQPDAKARYDGLVPSAAERLLGPGFALLDPAYADAPRHRFRAQVESIGIFLGGVDAGNHTQFVLDELDTAGWNGPVELVTTAANPHRAALAERTAEDPRLTLSCDLPDLAAFFARHDLQIGAGGGASWERCCIGAPTLALVTAENQRQTVPHLEAAGVVAGFDLAAPPRAGALAQALARLIGDADRRRLLHENSLQLVDGKGAARVARRLAALAQTAGNAGG